MLGDVRTLGTAPGSVDSLPARLRPRCGATRTTGPPMGRPVGDGGVGRAGEGSTRCLRDRVDRGSAAQGVHALLVPHEHPDPHRPLPRGDATVPPHWDGGGRLDAQAGGRGACGRARGPVSPDGPVRLHIIVRSALSDAVKHARLAMNPTDRSTPPSPSEAGPPELQARTARELGQFLVWAEARHASAGRGRAGEGRLGAARPRQRDHHAHTACQHVHPGMGRQAAERYAAMLRG